MNSHTAMPLTKRVRGVAVGFRPSHGLPVASLQIWARAGAAYERPGEAGVAHFLEHTMFESQTEPESLRAIVEGVGGTVNAWTSHDYLVVHASFLADAFPLVLQAMLACVLQPAFTPRMVETEKGVVLQEIARERENPSLTCTQDALSMLFEGHPYGRRVLGTPETVRRFSVADLRNYHARVFLPQNVFVSVAGRLDPGEVFELVDCSLRRVGWHAGKGAPPAPRVAKCRSGRVRHTSAETAETYFAVVYGGPHALRPDVAALDCFSAVLGETQGSVLEEWRRSLGLVTDVSSVMLSRRRGGAFMITGSVPPSQAGEALMQLQEVISSRLEQPPSDYMLAMVKQGLLSAALRMRETVHGMASRLGHELALRGRPGYFDEYTARAVALDTSAVLSAARKYLARTPVVHTLGPRPVSCGKRRWWSVTLRRPERLDAHTERRTLCGGAVLLWHRTPESGLTAVRLFMPHGTDCEDEGTLGSHALLGRLLMCGGGSFTGMAFARELDLLGAHMGFHAGTAGFSAWMEAPIQGMGGALEMLVTALLQPAFGEEEVRREAEYLREVRRSRIARPHALLDLELRRILYRGDPYGRDFLGEDHTLASLRGGRLRKLLDEVVSTAGPVVAVVGDVDPILVERTLRPVLERATWLQKPLPCARAMVPDATVILPGPFKQVHVALGWPAASLMDPEYLPTRLLASILSMSSGPLFAVLRDQLGVAYSVHAVHIAMTRGGYFVVRSSVRPGTEPLVLQKTREVLSRLSESTRDVAGVMERGARRAAGTEALAFQKKSKIAAYMCTHFSTPLGFDSFKDISQKLMEIPLSRVSRVASELACRRPAVVMAVPGM